MIVRIPLDQFDPKLFVAQAFVNNEVLATIKEPEDRPETHAVFSSWCNWRGQS
jgi:hypothetical protein